MLDFSIWGSIEKLLIAGIAAASFCGSPALAGSPTYNWTGFYLGANVGYGVARNPSGQSRTYTESAPFSTDSFTETFNLSPHGVLAGGQAGYNWQVAPNWVLGIEADIQGSAQTDSTTCVTTCKSSYTQISQKLPWFGTLRGRLGWTNGPALFYLTGGWAFGEVTKDVGTANELGLSRIGFDSRSFSQGLSGWTIGGGIESVISGNWTAKVEYLYVDLGHVTDSFVLTPLPLVSVSYAESSAIHNHVVRLGLNRRFGDAFHVAASPGGSAFNWSGFYLGGNFGYGTASNPSQSTFIFSGIPIFTETFNLAPHGVLGGGQAGYNWQVAPNWVLGIEADIQGSAQTDSTTCVNICYESGRSIRVSQKLPWFGTLRGRLGWTNGPALFYLTGGWAFGKVTTDVRTDYGGVDSRSFSHRLSGWTIGGGIESVISRP